MSYALMGIQEDGKAYIIMMCDKDADIDELVKQQPDYKMKDYVKFEIRPEETPDYD